MSVKMCRQVWATHHTNVCKILLLNLWSDMFPYFKWIGSVECLNAVQEAVGSIPETGPILRVLM